MLDSPDKSLQRYHKQLGSIEESSDSNVVCVALQAYSQRRFHVYRTVVRQHASLNTMHTFEIK